MKKLYSRYFPTPSFLAMNSCALDISDQSIKYGELLATPHGLQLGRFGQEKIPPGIIVSGKIEKQAELVQALKDLRKREHLRFVRISLPEEQMYVFTLSLPRMKIEEINNTILLQLEEHIPLQALDTIFDYEILSEDPQSFFIEVLAISTTVIESYLSVFRESGLIPLSFELEAQAIARAVIPQGDTSTVMIVDFGKARTGVSIAEQGRVLFTTTLDIGGNNLTNIIARNFAISFEEAEKLKLSNGVTDGPGAGDIFPIILNGLSVLRDELTKQYIYWKTHADEGKSHGEIDRIILCGGDANISGLIEYLESSMKLKVENANAWVNISDMESTVPDMPFEESFGYATVLGLALADHTKSESLINVLPLSEKQILRKDYWLRFNSVFLSLVVIIGVIGTILILPAYFLSVSKLTLAENRLEAFNGANPDIVTHDINTTIKDTNMKLALLSTKESPVIISDKILTLFIHNRPKGITLSSMLYSEKKITKGDTTIRTFEIRGIAVDRITLRNYKTLLTSNPDIAQVDLPISDFLDPSDINFTMTITLK